MSPLFYTKETSGIFEAGWKFITDGGVFFLRMHAGLVFTIAKEENSVKNGVKEKRDKSEH